MQPYLILMEARPKHEGLARKIAVGTIVFSFLLFGMVFLVPFFPLSLSHKAMVASVIWGLSEVTLLLGALLAGKEVMQKFKRYLTPKILFSFLKSKLKKANDDSVGF